MPWRLIGETVRHNGGYGVGDGEAGQHVEESRAGRGGWRALSGSRRVERRRSSRICGGDRLSPEACDPAAVTGAWEPTAARERQVVRRYGAEVRDALVVLWDASDRSRSKRLKQPNPFLPSALERDGRLCLSAELRHLVLAVSPASMDRLLSDVRLVASGGRRRRAGFSSEVRRQVPVRTSATGAIPAGLPGGRFRGALRHLGRGSFVRTSVLTDATGWTECLAIVMRNGVMAIEALARAAALFPFPLRGLDLDNDDCS